MRSLETCRAEIFRRSEIRIQKRKKRRKQILACGVPLCACLLFVPVLRFGFPEKNCESAPECGNASFTGSPEDGREDSALPSLTKPGAEAVSPLYTEVEIRTETDLLNLSLPPVLLLSEESEVADLYQVLDDFCSDAALLPPDAVLPDDEEHWCGIRMLFSDGNGESLCMVLTAYGLWIPSDSAYYEGSDAALQSIFAAVDSLLERYTIRKG